MRDRNWRVIPTRYDHAGAKLGDGPQLLGERLGQPNAAVRGWMVRNNALMQCQAGPGDPLHEIHWRVVIYIGAMPAVLLDYAEHAGRCCVAGCTTRGTRLGDCFATSVEREPLLVAGDDDLQRTLRGLLGQRAVSCRCRCRWLDACGGGRTGQCRAKHIRAVGLDHRSTVRPRLLWDG